MAVHMSRPTLTIVSVLLAVLVCLPSVAGAQVIDMNVIGALTGGVPRDAVIDGDYAYVAAQGALSILDISNYM